MRDIFLGLGANLGDRRENLTKAVNRLSKTFRILQASSLYETEPVGHKEQGWFLNCTVEIETGLSCPELLVELLSVEKILGRVRKFKGGPRKIDIDILFYGRQIIREEGLVVPHPRLHERLFVLAPLNEICPDFVHPVRGVKIRDLVKGLAERQKVNKISDRWEWQNKAVNREQRG